MFEIIKNEWRFILRNHIFIGISLVFIFTVFLTVLLGNNVTKTESESHHDAREHIRQQWTTIDGMNPHRAAHFGTYIFKPVNLLNSLDEGIENITGNTIKVEGHVQNEIIHSETSQMQTISRFGKLTASLILKFILPVLLIFLAFNAISHDKRSGRLKLMILQGASIVKIILSKTIAVWLYSIFLLIFIISTYCILNIEHLTTQIAIRTLLFFLAYACYYFIITGLTFYCTIRSKNERLALTAMLSVWIIWTMFLPSIVMSATEQWDPLPTRNTFQSAMKEDRSKGIDGHNPTDKRGLELKEEVLKKYNVDSLSQLPINFDGLRMQADEDYGNSVWDKHFGHNRDILHKQKQNFQLFGSINPFISLHNLSMGFMASDNLHHQKFLLQVEDYRRDFIKTLNEKQTFGGSKTGNWGWKEDNSFFKSIPDFKYKPVALSSVVSYYLTDIILLLIWTLCIVLLIFFGTKKLQLL